MEKLREKKINKQKTINKQTNHERNKNKNGKKTKKTIWALHCALNVAQFTSATRKGRNHPEDGVLRVATRDCHVQAVQALSKDVHYSGGELPNLLVLKTN